MNKSAIEIEGQKLKIVEHLIAEVTDGISGRDQEDIFDAAPSRILFAGVLQPPRHEDAIQAGGSGIIAPANTSLGLDFKVATEAGRSIRLRIRTRWSLYYP